MFRKIILSLFIFTAFLGTASAVLPRTAYAATRTNCAIESGSFLAFPTWYKFLEPDGSSGECRLKYLDDPKGGLINAVPRVLLAVFEIILRIAGIAAVGFVIYGGIQYILSQGEPENTKASKNTIINALVGLVVAMMSTVIVNLIGNGIS